MNALGIRIKCAFLDYDTYRADTIHLQESERRDFQVERDGQGGASVYFFCTDKGTGQEAALHDLLRQGRGDSRLSGVIQQAFGSGRRRYR